MSYLLAADESTRSLPARFELERRACDVRRDIRSVTGSLGTIASEDGSTASYGC